MSTVPVSEARATLPDLLERVRTGEEVTLTRHGRAVAVLVRPDALRARRAEGALEAAEELRAVVEQARTRRLEEMGAIDAGRAAVLVEAVERSRSAR